MIINSNIMCFLIELLLFYNPNYSIDDYELYYIVCMYKCTLCIWSESIATAKLRLSEALDIATAILNT